MKTATLEGHEYFDLLGKVKEIMEDPPSEKQLWALSVAHLVLDRGMPKTEDWKDFHNAFREAVQWELRWRTRFVRFNDAEPVKLLLREGAVWRWGRLDELVSLANPEMQTVLRQADQQAAG
jgi:hypothetical protein